MNDAPPLPASEEIAYLLGTLLDRRVKVTVVAKNAGVALAKGAHVALYVDETGTARFVGVADLTFGASVGAALALIPPALVGEAVKAGELSGALFENAYEVLNIAASTFNEAKGAKTHVKLRELRPFQQVDPAIIKAIKDGPKRLDVEIEIPTYGKGKLTLVVLPFQPSQHPHHPPTHPH